MDQSHVFNFNILYLPGTMLKHKKKYVLCLPGTYSLAIKQVIISVMKYICENHNKILTNIFKIN